MEKNGLKRRVANYILQQNLDLEYKWENRYLVKLLLNFKLKKFVMREAFSSEIIHIIAQALLSLMSAGARRDALPTPRPASDPGPGLDGDDVKAV